jgi:hypothetical protein
VLDGPAVVCQAFAIEQFLKLLLLLETGGYPDREHAHEKQFLVASDESLARLGMVLRDTVKELRPGLVSVFETA